MKSLSSITRNCHCQAGYDPMSDKLSCMFLNPYHLVLDATEKDPSKMKIPWSLRGLMVANLLGSLVQSAVMCPDVSAVQKLENVMTFHVCIDIGQLMAWTKETACKVRKGTLYWHPETILHMKQLCGFLMIQLTSVDTSSCWLPHKSTECIIEEWFGMLRGKYASSQMSCRDYLRSSLQKQKWFLDKTQRSMSKPVERPEIPHQNARVSEAAFRECARRALSSACTLMSLISKRNKADIEDMFLSWADENASQMEKQALSSAEEGWLNA